MFNISNSSKAGSLLRAAMPVYPDFHLLKKRGRPGMMRASFVRFSPILLLAVALGAPALFASPVAAATLDPPQYISVTPGHQKLTLTWAWGDLNSGHPGFSGVAVRWRVKDTDPDTDGNQPGGWIPSPPGYQQALSGQFNARSVPIPAHGCYFNRCGPLSNGTTYEVGANFHGTKGSTGWLSAGEGTPRPAAPSDLEVTPGLGKLDLTWTAPSGTVSGYDVHYTRSTSVNDNAALGTNAALAWVDAAHSGVAAEHTISGLTGLTEDEAYHRVRVRAKAAAANGVWAHGAGSAQVRLSSPRNVTLKPGDGQVAVSWDAVEGADGYVIEYGVVTYEILPWESKEVTAGNVTTYTVTGLTNNTNYTFSIRASDSTGAYLASIWSSWKSIGEGTPRPSVPRYLEVKPSLGKLSLTWTAPSGTVSGYDVHYTRSTSVNDNAALGTNAALAWVDAAHSGVAAEHTISGLTGLTEDEAYHRVRVRAKAAAANGDWVVVVYGFWVHGTGTVPVRLSTPQNVVLTAGDGQVAVSWDAVDGANEYVIEYTADRSVPAEKITTGNVTTYTVTGLTNDERYFFRIKARDSNGAYPAGSPGRWREATPRPIGGL